MLALNLCKGMLPVAWNIHYSSFSSLCLPGLTFKGLTLSIHIEFKVVEQRITFVLFKGYWTGILWPDLYGWLQEQRILKPRTLQQSTTPPPFFSIKEAWISLCPHCGWNNLQRKLEFLRVKYFISNKILIIVKGVEERWIFRVTLGQSRLQI